jgi:metallo-beta-lactamase class B
MRHLKSIFIFLLGFGSQVFGQSTLRLTSLPAKYTPDLDTLFVAGDFNNWNPRSATHRFQKNGQGILQVAITSSQSNLSYKITRGNWGTVEVAANGQDIPNRSSSNNPGQIHEIQVADWADTKGNHTTGNQVQILGSQIWLPALKRYRRVWVCLPGNYATEPNRRFPVMYFHDGQNCFDVASSFAGEWRIDEALTQLENVAGWEPIIAVGVDNGGAERISELTPFRHPSYGGGNGENYALAIAQTIKPLIDSLFRTKKEAEFTAIGGSSLGGIESLFMAYAHPNIFSKALIFSPSLWFSDSLRQYCLAQPQPLASKLYWVCGTNEGDPDMVPDMNQCFADLLNAGMPSAQMSKKVVQGGTHSEGFWSTQVKEGIQWLFSGSPVRNLSLSDLPDLSIHQFEEQIELNNSLQKPLTFRLVDIMGRQQILETLKPGKNQFRISGKGIYFIEIPEKGLVRRILSI